MPLMTMTSDLSWYGNPGWTPNPNTQTTDFQYNADLTATAIPRGFDQAGHQVSFIPRTTQDAYPIDTALGPNGSAKRKAQRGNGSLFPIGPNGQVHVFDTKRTGWYNEDRYGDTFSSKTITGLAATYTANSPIDDMYNKFKVRDEAYNPYGSMPFILRGIQRDGSSDPQRWGDINTNFEIKSLADVAKLRFLTDTKTVAGAVSALDVPRAGIAAFTDRTIHDTIRVGKFLLHPRGNAFIAKQQLLRLMSPNIEGISGGVYKLSPQKLYNPINTLLTVAGVGIGLHARNYGILPTGGLSRYEDIHKAREIAQLGIIGNRLARLNNQRTGNRVSQVIPTWNVLTGYTGPDSFGGIGITDFKRISDYDTYRTNDIRPAAILDDLTAEYDNLFPYVKTRNGLSAPGAGISIQQSVDDRTRTSIISTYRKPSLLRLGSILQGTNLIRGSITRLPIQQSIDAQFAFHGGEIVSYKGEFEVAAQTTSYLEPYSGDRNNSSAPITNNTKPLTEDGEDTLLGSLKAKVREPYEFRVGLLENQLNFHQDSITGYGNLSTIINRTTSYDLPYSGDRNDSDSEITNDAKPLTEDGAENTLKGSLKNRVTGSFTGIPTNAPNPAKAEDQTPAIAKYKTLAYGSIPNDSKRPQPTLESEYGYKSYSVANKRNGNTSGPVVSQPDPINNIELGGNYGSVKDLIKFSFAAINATTLGGANNNVIFRAYLTDLGDNFAPSWDSVQDQGRADAKVRYASFERTIDVGFKVVVHSAAESKNVWDKLSQLAKITYPAYGGGGFYGIYIKVTIGDLYVNQPMFITSLSYTWDTETPWEISDGRQLPMYTDVNMSLTWIGEKRPDYGTAQVFSYR